MHWDRLFEDLEGQLTAEWEAERAALDAEAERLRISRLDLRSRLRRCVHDQATITVLWREEQRLRGRAVELGADWIAIVAEDDRGTCIVPIEAAESYELDHGLLLATLEDSTPESTVRERMSFGFLVRDLARRRLPLQVCLTDGSILQGTADRAGADHLDLALHDSGVPRRAGAVRGFRILPFRSIRWVRADARSVTVL